MHRGACIGDAAVIYNLGMVELGDYSIVAQESYLCTATHDFDKEELPLQIAKITIGAHSFVGARAFVLPGVIVGEGALVGAGSVVTKDVEAWTVCAGNPCRLVKRRRPAPENSG